MVTQGPGGSRSALVRLSRDTAAIKRHARSSYACCVREMTRGRSPAPVLADARGPPLCRAASSGYHSRHGAWSGSRGRPRGPCRIGHAVAGREYGCRPRIEVRGMAQASAWQPLTMTRPFPDVQPARPLLPTRRSWPSLDFIPITGHYVRFSVSFIAAQDRPHDVRCPDLRCLDARSSPQVYGDGCGRRPARCRRRKEIAKRSQFVVEFQGPVVRNEANRAASAMPGK